jgi:cytidylate kinase
MNKLHGIDICDSDIFAIVIQSIQINLLANYQFVKKCCQNLFNKLS